MSLKLDSMEIHNAVPVFNNAQQGWELPRYPQALREVINTRARTTSRMTTGVEVRFVSSGPEFCLTLRTMGDPASIIVRKGSFWVQRLEIEPGKTQRFLIKRPEIKGVKKDVLYTGSWSPDVWRIQFDGSDTLLQDIDPLGWKIRPPKTEEKPTLKWLAYGSSITHADLHGYPFVAARLLNVDIMNKGLSGSCQIEPEIANWFASLKFDIASLELGINMRGHFEPEEFGKRVRYLVRRMRKSNSNAPIVLITHFLNRDHHPDGEPTLEGQYQQAFDEILRQIHAEFKDPHLHLIEGTEILNDFHLLSADLIHPTIEGQAQMGVNLAARLHPLLLV